MEKLDFVKLACSTDTLRPYLCEVYRDKKHLVASDGHRLHYSNGLSEVSTPGYIDGRNEQFPDWQNLLPVNKPEYSCNVTINKEDIARLKALLGIAKLISKRECPAFIWFNEGRLETEITSKELINANSRLLIDVQKGMRIIKPDNGLNLSYVFDVFNAAYSASKLQAKVEINYYSGLSPWTFTTTLGTALIMPQKLDK